MGVGGIGGNPSLDKMMPVQEPPFGLGPIGGLLGQDGQNNSLDKEFFRSEFQQVLASLKGDQQPQQR
jgi:hypothetical protein